MEEGDDEEPDADEPEPDMADEDEGEEGLDPMEDDEDGELDAAGCVPGEVGEVEEVEEDDGVLGEVDMAVSCKGFTEDAGTADVRGVARQTCLLTPPVFGNSHAGALVPHEGAGARCGPARPFSAPREGDL